MQTDPLRQSLPSESEALDEDRAWALLRAVAKMRRAGAAGSANGSRLVLALDEPFVPREIGSDSGCLSVDPVSGQFELGQEATPAAARLFELYLPVCLGTADHAFVFAHIGQSLDGQIATSTGASQYVTGPENIRHLHRLRALADAVLVGAGTVERDDPQLTTRLVPGDSPVRVVIDPGLRLSENQRVFSDARVATLVICSARAARGRQRVGAAEVLPLDTHENQFSPRAVTDALSQRGLRYVFIEGGGITVSRFLAARALDRLHLTISPVFLGQGRPGIVLPAIAELAAALRPSVRRFALGDDVLFDCCL